MDFQSDRPEGYTGKADQYIPDVIQGLKRVLIKAQDSLTNKTLHLSKRNLGELASVLVEFAEGIHTLESIIKYFSKLYRNFYFIYAGYTMYGVENPPCGLQGGIKSPLEKGVRGL